LGQAPQNADTTRALLTEVHESHTAQAVQELENAVACLPPGAEQAFNKDLQERSRI